MTTPVILTGAGSFLGEYVLKALDAKGIDTFALSREATAVCRRNSLSARIKPVEIDLSVPEQEWCPPSNGPHAIIHLAFDRMVSADSAQGTKFNSRITQNVLGICRASSISSIVNASSTSVYGTPDGGLVSAETAPISPSAYGVAKLSAEQLLVDASKVASVVSVRLPAILGRAAHPENWLVRVAHCLMQNKDLTYSSPDFRFNNAVLASDVAKFFVELAAMDDLPVDVRATIGSTPGPCLSEILHQMRSDLKSTSELKISPSDQTPFGIDNSAAEKWGYQPRSILETVRQFTRDLTQGA